MTPIKPLCFQPNGDQELSSLENSASSTAKTPAADEYLSNPKRKLNAKMMISKERLGNKFKANAISVGHGSGAEPAIERGLGGIQSNFVT